MHQAPSTEKVIFSNLGPTTSNAYNDTTGYYILGPNNSVGLPEQYIGVPFTPRSSAHITNLYVAVGSISGTNLINVGLYSDNMSGTVGTLLASAQASTILASFGACCQVVGVSIPSDRCGVTNGTQYWIAVSSMTRTHRTSPVSLEASNSGEIAGEM